MWKWDWQDFYMEKLEPKIDIFALGKIVKTAL